ncbi:MAG: ABC transporter ATP-binding protein [Chloroflexota bacterium]
MLRVLQAVLPVISAYLIKLVFDRLGMILTTNAVFSFQSDMLPFVLLLGLVITIGQGLIALDTYLTEEMARRLQLHTSTLIYSHLLRLQGMHYFESPRFHDTLEQATDHLQWTPAELVRSASSFIGSLLTVVGFIGVVLVFSPLLALLLFLATIPTFITQMRFSRNRFALSWYNSPKERKSYYLGTLLSQTLYAKEVRLFNLGEYFLNQYRRVMGDIHDKQRELSQEELHVNTGLNLFSAALTVGSYVYVIAQAFALRISLGDVTLYIEAVRNMQQHLSVMAWTVASLSERTLFFSHYETLTALQPSIEQLHPSRDVPSLTDAIELRNVSFRYTDESEYVLRGVSLTLRKGETLALVGLNGAGKTTIVKLLTRFYDPTEGEILWDGIDIRHFDPADLRGRMGAVLQDFNQYDLTARENIGLGDTRYIEDMERVRQVAQTVGVDGFIRDLPQGYETVLSRWLVESGKNGTDLSGGQWQKVAIARMYMRNADVMLLDEPTAALDAEAELDIHERFVHLAQNRASLLISHRFSTVRMADKIAVLEDGRITEYGTHAELMTRNSTYAQLYKVQAAQYT